MLYLTFLSCGSSLAWPYSFLIRTYWSSIRIFFFFFGLDFDFIHGSSRPSNKPIIDYYLGLILWIYCNCSFKQHFLRIVLVWYFFLFQPSCYRDYCVASQLWSFFFFWERITTLILRDKDRNNLKYYFSQFYFFIVKYVFISIKYLIKFGTKHTWIYIFFN